jgi:hypothetical protein
MKNLIICLLLTALIIWLLTLTSCTHYCDPENIQSGRSNQHHDSKPFRAKIKIINAQQQGSSCYVKYMNMKEITYRLYEHCNCGKFEEGKWVSTDSI